MNSEIRKLLESVRSGETSVDDAMLELSLIHISSPSGRSGRALRGRRR